MTTLVWHHEDLIERFLSLKERLYSFSSSVMNSFSKDEAIETNRIFLFIDLNSSMQKAERMGHINFSQFLKEYYRLLHKIARKYQAEIYQVVGDGAILTWNNSSVNIQKAIDLFFAFRGSLNARHHFFMQNFGCSPEMKGAMHAGVVAKTFLSGGHKAYQGDVINTVARLVQIAGQYSLELIATTAIAGSVPNMYQKISIGSVLLKGKSNSLEVYQLQPVD